jgi:Cft2 family RNA processing exonuclease
MKREIMDAQHNFHGLQHQDALYKLNRFKIKEKEDIYDLSSELAVMEFDENDVLQTLKQIESIPLKEKKAIIPGILSLTIYSAGHIEGATQSVWEVI